jgi:hypothetical protein
MKKRKRQKRDIARILFCTLLPDGGHLVSERDAHRHTKFDLAHSVIAILSRTISTYFSRQPGFSSCA